MANGRAELSFLLYTRMRDTEEDMDAITLCEQIKYLRKAAKITQTELADKLGVHLQTVSKWERGISVPDISQLGEIASLCGVTLEKLLQMPEDGKVYSGKFDMQNMCNKVAELRRNKGESQAELAEACNLSADSVSRWERGVSCPDVYELCQLAEHYGTSVSELYFGVNEQGEIVAPIKVKNTPRNYRMWALAATCAVLIVALTVLGVVSAVVSNISYTVTVDGVTEKVASNQLYTPEVEEKQGYILVGWTDDNGNRVSFPCSVRRNSTFYPEYRAQDYDVDYWLNGGEFQSTPEYTVNVESVETDLPTPYKDGTDFVGWYDTADYSGEQVTKLKCVFATLRLYARWQDGECTIKYYLNGGAIKTPNPETVSTKETITLNAPMRVGYIFLGWFDSADGGKEYTEVGGENASNLTLYARWQRIDCMYKVTYETDGGINSTRNVAELYPDELVGLYAPVKVGYEFLGWYDNPEFSGKAYTYLYNVMQDITLYAKYAPKTYVIVYQLDGGKYLTGEVNPNRIAYGQTVDLLPLRKYGYDFVGWYDAQFGGNKVERLDENNIDNITTLYAVFSEQEFDVTLDANGGTLPDGKGDKHTYKVKFYEEFELPTPVKKNCTFIGWRDESGATVTRVTFQNVGNITLYAAWVGEDATYRVTYDLGGGSWQGAPGPSEVAVKEYIAFPEPVRSGFIFLGWYGDDGICYAVSPAGNTNDLHLTARWQAVGTAVSADKITYISDGTSVEIVSIAYQVGDSIVLPDYIDGLPVKKLGNVFPHAKLNRVVLPDTLEEIGAQAFYDAKVSEELVIPRNVQAIGYDAFCNFYGKITFGENCRIKVIGQRAFNCAMLDNVLVLPSTVTRIEKNAFYWMAVRGLVLNEGLTYIGENGINILGGMYVYLPSTVKSCTKAGAPVYVSSANTYGISGTVASSANVRLHVGNSVTTITGECIVLPDQTQQGKRFLGWKDAQGNYVQKVYCPLSDKDLYAVFADATDSDGTTSSTPLKLRDGEKVKVSLTGLDNLYFVIDTDVQGDYIVNMKVNGVVVSDCIIYKVYYSSFTSFTTVDKLFSYTPQTVLSMRPYYSGSATFVKPFEVELAVFAV